MALIVEDGTGLSNAESYESVAGADAYFTSIGNTTWSLLSTPAKESSLRQGTQYLDMTFVGRWKGMKIKNSSLQSLAWPRMNVIDADGFLVYSNIIPTALKRATAEAALRASSSDILADITQPGSISSYRIKVGPIEEATSYSGGSSQIPLLRKVQLLVKDLITPFTMERGG